MIVVSSCALFAKLFQCLMSWKTCSGKGRLSSMRYVAAMGALGDGLWFARRCLCMARHFWDVVSQPIEPPRSNR